VPDVSREQADQRRRAFQKVGLAVPERPCTTAAEVAAALEGHVVAHGSSWRVRTSEGWEPGYGGLVGVLIGGLMHVKPYDSQIARIKRDVKDRLRIIERPTR
jgi:hypothetical protein